ncbi:tryptophan halogenase family protein [Novosphingobium taihuense]|uniref:Tryptophan halogenase n=1 Tax=Novosphingobium taihuense TaxID=260085 RepID=A0A7W7ET45_9SPHN|nr:tryptophan halogenase family protein [Novosphingobium taihuense]MBB4612887.1 tryptophan halogenase [Novosphingobium taihuense]TWH81924.1 tryptophan halogenase [Novosphingobium taihuense]
MGQPIRNITIVGGGTTGWLAALFLVTRLQGAVRRGELDIHLIESERIPIIGVGESLSPSMATTLEQLGIPEDDFIRDTDATFKVAGYFVGWDAADDGRPLSWVNPFVGFMTAGWEFERYELTGGAYGDGPDYARVVSPCREAIELRKSPKMRGQKPFEHVLRYAYHTNAAAFAPFLRKHAEARGVRRTGADVIGATRDERGHISTITLEGAREVPVELVIDASGFSSVLHHKVMGVPLVDYSHILLNDRAVVTQLAHANPDEPLEPATRATALPHGWAFRVPLYHRTGNGFIYSSKHCSDEAAANEFAGYLGSGARVDDMRVIPMRVGRTQHSWEGNCIALGLAAGFVEPLEASAIFTVETSVKWLLHYFPDSDWEPALRDRYNSRVTDLYDEVADYIALHYRLSRREDTSYWRAQRHEMKVSDRLEQNLSIWRHTLPVRADFASTNYFDENTYIAALFGKGFYRGRELQPMREVDARNWAGLKQNITSAHARALGMLPDHRAVLTEIRTRASG